MYTLVSYYMYQNYILETALIDFIWIHVYTLVSYYMYQNYIFETALIDFILIHVFTLVPHEPELYTRNTHYRFYLNPCVYPCVL